MTTDHNKELIEYDQRYGIPSFEGWQEREQQAFEVFWNLPENQHLSENEALLKYNQ